MLGSQSGVLTNTEMSRDSSRELGPLPGGGGEEPLAGLCEGPGPAGGHTEVAVTRAQAPPLLTAAPVTLGAGPGAETQPGSGQTSPASSARTRDSDQNTKKSMLARSLDQARAAAWPGVITYIIITNKPRPDTPHCPSHWLDDITCPDTSSLAQF